MRFIGAVLILSGMIIGAGMFGIPFSFAKSGFILGSLELLILTGAVLVFHLLYGEIVLKTEEKHRLPGYIQKYLGRSAAKAAWLSSFFGIIGTLAAYLVLGAVFLANIFSSWFNFSELSWVLILVSVVGVATFLPFKNGVLINGLATVFLVVLVFLLSLIFLPKIEFANLTGFNFSNLFFPYGVLLFALSGGVVIPDLVTFLEKEKRKIKSAIVAGTLLPAALYFLFALAMVGALGNKVGPEAISSFAAIGGGNLMLIGSLIGFLAVFTSLLVLSSSFQALLALDLKFPQKTAWFFGSMAPLFLYALGLKDFFFLISAVGAVAIGVDSVLTIASYHNMRRREKRAVSGFSYFWSWGIYFMIAAGTIYEVYRLL